MHVTLVLIQWPIKQVTDATWIFSQLLAEWNIPLWAYSVALPCIASCAAGSLGGLVNYTITQRRQPRPEAGTSVPSQTGWLHGALGDVFIGAVVGLVTFLGGFNDVPVPKILLAAVLGGVSGATYFTKTAEVKEARRQANTGKVKSRALKKVSELALGRSRKEDANGE
jgi:hypothetical protein